MDGGVGDGNGEGDGEGEGDCDGDGNGEGGGVGVGVGEGGGGGGSIVYGARATSLPGPARTKWLPTFAGAPLTVAGTNLSTATQFLLTSKFTSALPMG